MTPPFHIRPLDDHDDFDRAVEFQQLIWGPDFDQVVPAAVFWFARRVGAILAGAFDDSGMIGLLFGVTGWDGERPVHWSDMLGVHPDARGRGVGLALKRYQRERLLEAGVTIAQWTFDPLEARNAWLNFARLGVTAREYIRDAYNASRSPLHQGIGTDRLVVEWRVASDRVRMRMDGIEGPATLPADAPVINPPASALRLDLDEERLWLRVPRDIQRLKSEWAAEATRWREETRSAFETYLGRGYKVMEVAREASESRYLLVR